MSNPGNTYATSSRAAPEFVNTGLEEISAGFIIALVQVLAHDEGMNEINFFKTTMKTPEGGTYVLTFQHVDGPKVDLVGLRQAARAEAEKDKKDHKDQEPEPPGQAPEGPGKTGKERFGVTPPKTPAE